MFQIYYQFLQQASDFVLNVSESVFVLYLLQGVDFVSQGFVLAEVLCLQTMISIKRHIETAESVHQYA